MMSTAQKEALKARVIAARRYWHPFHEALLELSPEYLEAYLNYNNAPFVSKHIEQKVCELIYVAIDASVTHLYASGMARHMGFAFEHGATDAEILETIQLTMLTTHMTHEAGIPMLVEELRKVDPDIDAKLAELTPEQAELKASFIEATGYWPACGDALFRFAPDFVTSFLAYRSIPWSQGPLPPKIKALISLAVCAAPTTVNEAGMRAHIQAALHHGATPEEIADVLQLASAISTHTCTIAVPALLETRAAAAARKDGAAT